MNEDILTDIQREGSTPQEFLADKEPKEEPNVKEDEQEEKPADSSAEETQTETAPSPDGADEAEGKASNNQDDSNLPFHKHPRWKAINDRNEYLERAFAESLEAQRQMLERVAPKAEPTQQVPEIPEWFSKAYGDDPEVWAAQQEFMRGQSEAIRAEIKREAEMESQRQEEEKNHWNKWADESLSTVEKTYNVKLKDGEPLTNEFLKFVVDYKPSDDQGNLDLVKGWKLFSDLRREDPAKMTAKKALAATTTAPDKANTSKQRDYFTSGDLRHKGWKSL